MADHQRFKEASFQSLNVVCEKLNKGSSIVACNFNAVSHPKKEILWILLNHLTPFHYFQIVHNISWHPLGCFLVHYLIPRVLQKKSVSHT